MVRNPGVIVPRHVRLLVLDLEHVVFDAIPLKLGAVRRAILPVADDIPHSVCLPDGADLEEAYASRGWRWFEAVQLGLPKERLLALEPIVRAEARFLASGEAGRIYPGVMETLGVCRQAGLLLALGADCDRDFMLAVSDRHGFDGVFNFMACAEDYGIGGFSELLEDVAERLEVHASECVYLGTRGVCIEEALALGVATLGCRWGLHCSAVIDCANGQAERPDQLPGLLQEIDLRLMESDA
jgi:phosphoglycolate phosphatase-like HAD superfamily hydrolase